MQTNAIAASSHSFTHFVSNPSYSVSIGDFLPIIPIRDGYFDSFIHNLQLSWSLSPKGLPKESCELTLLTLKNRSVAENKKLKFLDF